MSEGRQGPTYNPALVKLVGTYKKTNFGTVLISLTQNLEIKNSNKKDGPRGMVKHCDIVGSRHKIAEE